MAEIGSKGGRKILKKRGRKWFSEMAKRSHPRKEYRGGRKPKPKPEAVASPAGSPSTKPLSS